MLRSLLILVLIGSPTLAAAGSTLFEAAAMGDTAALTDLLDKGEPVDSRAPDQATPLISAALAGQLDITKLLIAKGADVMARNSGGFTALHAAAYSGSVAVVSVLLDNKSVLDDAANKAGATPLFVAAEMNQKDVVELLIARGSDVKRPEAHGYLATTRALWKGHTGMVSLLKRHGLPCQEGTLSASEYARCLAIK
jgi:ankyrin repeat protein